ncbi:MAG TPA: hypothetical protein VD999_00300 [Vitreimonas sp.]|nr:hypothetical protein [Vitreimonas sp.]
MYKDNKLFVEPPSTTFSRMTKDHKRDNLSSLNIGLTLGDKSKSGSDLKNSMAESGFAPVLFEDFFLSLAYIIHRDNIELPVGKSKKQERGKICEQILNTLDISVNEKNELKISDKNNSGIDIIGECKTLEAQSRVQEMATTLSEDSMILGRLLSYITDFVDHSQGLIINQKSPDQISINGPKITVVNPDTDNLKPQFMRDSDRIIRSKDPNVIRFGVMREAVQFTSYESRREALADKIDRHEIMLFPKFGLENWPTDYLGSHLREQVAPLVKAFVQYHNLLCDQQDLKYQTLFRLSTFSISEIFENGEELDEYLYKMGAYKNWRNILCLEENFVKKFNLNKSLVTKIIEEQYLLIADRLSKSELPLKEILTPSGIFAEQGWVIQKRNGEVMAIQEEGVTSASMQIPLEFREIDNNWGAQFHGDLHYIHTPRADKAFGLFIQGEEIPFSVLALDRIDRAYKQNTLLMKGYDPRKCYDLTRLYSRPGTPGNTSSSMFSLTFKYLAAHYPEVQGVMSAFTPSYATGVSMTSGGFDNPVLLKPLQHTFIEKMVGDQVCYEHVTNRRLEQAPNHKKLRSKIPLLPTVELFAKLQNPRFEPFKVLEKSMVELY